MPRRFEIKPMSDYQREEEEFNARKAASAQDAELKAAKIERLGQPGGGNLPAAMQMANEYGLAIKEGRMEDAANLERFAKTVDKGLMRQDGGGYGEMEGYGTALGGLAGAKQGAQTQAKENVLATTVPQRKEDIATREAEVDLEYRPQIKQAETKAADIAKKEIELGERASYMPELEATLADLGKYADDATYTLGGQAVDFLAKELGGKDTEGATARVGFDTTVSNQVLPLLRQTFGAAFTAKEGDSLRATLGDVNATPSQKRTAIDVFLKQAKRNINSRERELSFPLTDWAGGGVANPQVLATFENKKTQPSAPKKGSKVDGYWFMGGDPADENNYQKVK